MSKMAKTRTTLAHDEARMEHFNCPDCGDVDFVLLDAYAVFDRLGEGVMFEIRIDINGNFKATPDKEALDYLKRIRANVKAWCKDMEKYAEDIEADGFEFTCPKCRGDIYHGFAGFADGQ